MSRNERTAGSRIIVAADTSSKPSLAGLLQRLQGRQCWIKVGLELFGAHGPEAIRMVRNAGFKVFLDLKLCDIPNTVGRAVAAIARHEVDMLTVHALGGPEMLKAAVESARRAAYRPAILAVTVLTSIDDRQLAAMGIGAGAADFVDRLAGVALAEGADGLVCSPREAERLRRHHGAGPLLVTPGIRPAGSSAGDQRRIATPREAILAGADYIVVGRPITAAEDPAAAFDTIAAELES